jgi:hypothetical protein
MSEPYRIDRRHFAESLALGTSAIASLLPFALSAEEKSAVEPKEDAKTVEVAEVPVRPSEEVLLLTCLTQRYPSEHFDDAVLQGIYRDLRGDVARGRILSEFPLKNSDEPSYLFRVYRGSQ